MLNLLVFDSQGFFNFSAGNEIKYVDTNKNKCLTISLFLLNDEIRKETLCFNLLEDEINVKNISNKIKKDKLYYFSFNNLSEFFNFNSRFIFTTDILKNVISINEFFEHLISKESHSLDIDYLFDIDKMKILTDNLFKLSLINLEDKNLIYDIIINSSK